MGCMCAECRFAKKTENPNLVLCDNWESDNYGSEMDDRGDSCDFGEVDIITKTLEDKSAEKFIPYRCSECKNGEYLLADNTWDCMCNVTNDKECEELFEDGSEV